MLKSSIIHDMGRSNQPRSTLFGRLIPDCSSSSIHLIQLLSFNYYTSVTATCLHYQHIHLMYMLWWKQVLTPFHNCVSPPNNAFQTSQLLALLAQLSTLKTTSVKAACLHHQHIPCIWCVENRSLTNLTQGWICFLNNVTLGHHSC